MVVLAARQDMQLQTLISSIYIYVHIHTYIYYDVYIHTYIDGYAKLPNSHSTHACATTSARYGASARLATIQRNSLPFSALQPSQIPFPTFAYFTIRIFPN